MTCPGCGARRPVRVVRWHRRGDTLAIPPGLAGLLAEEIHVEPGTAVGGCSCQTPWCAETRDALASTYQARGGRLPGLAAQARAYHVSGVHSFFTLTLSQGRRPSLPVYMYTASGVRPH